MQPREAATLAALLASIGSPVCAQIYNPDNGHYYQFVSANATWEQAREQASQMRFAQTAGHLATLTTPDEVEFVVATHGYQFPAGFGGAPVWIGGYKDTAWRWVTGEPFDYTSWALGEPNNLWGEEALEINDAGVWNDTSGARVGSGFVVEYPAPAAAPAPLAWWRWTLSFLAILVALLPFLWRR